MLHRQYQLAQLLFLLALGGNVFLDRHIVRDAPISLNQGHDDGHFDVLYTIARMVDEFTHPGLAAQQGLPHVLVGLHGRLAGLEQPRVLAEHFLTGKTGVAHKGVIDVLDVRIQVGHDDGVRTLLHHQRQLLQLSKVGREGFTRAQGADAKGQIARHLAQQLHLRVAEGIAFLGMQAQRTNALPTVHQQWQRNGGSIPTLQCGFSPRSQCGVGEHITRDHRAALTNGRPGGTSALRHIRPGDARGGQVVVVKTVAGHGSHGAFLVVLRSPHPCHPIAAHLHRQATNALHELVFMLRMDQQLPTLPRRAQGAIGLFQLSLRVAAFNEIGNAFGDGLKQRALFGKERLTRVRGYTGQIGHTYPPRAIPCPAEVHPKVLSWRTAAVAAALVINPAHSQFRVSHRLRQALRYRLQHLIQIMLGVFREVHHVVQARHFLHALAQFALRLAVGQAGVSKGQHRVCQAAPQLELVAGHGLDAGQRGRVDHALGQRLQCGGEHGHAGAQPHHQKHPGDHHGQQQRSPHQGVANRMRLELFFPGLAALVCELAHQDGDGARFL